MAGEGRAVRLGSGRSGSSRDRHGEEEPRQRALLPIWISKEIGNGAGGYDAGIERSGAA